MFNEEEKDRIAETYLEAVNRSSVGVAFVGGLFGGFMFCAMAADASLKAVLPLGFISLTFLILTGVVNDIRMKREKRLLEFYKAAKESSDLLLIFDGNTPQEKAHKLLDQWRDLIAEGKEIDESLSKKR